MVDIKLQIKENSEIYKLIGTNETKTRGFIPHKYMTIQLRRFCYNDPKNEWCSRSSCEPALKIINYKYLSNKMSYSKAVTYNYLKTNSHMPLDIVNMICGYLTIDTIRCRRCKHLIIPVKKYKHNENCDNHVFR
jgi:hypothetical protein